MGERCIIVDSGVTREESFEGKHLRYMGRRVWAYTVADAVPFDSREEAEKMAKLHAGTGLGALRVVPVVAAGAKRARAAAQAAEDNVATMRAELDGLRATDAECAAALARWQLRAELAETSYDVLRRVLDSTRHTLGATALESAEAAAMRVVSERDAAVRDLAELRRAIEVLTVRMGG